MSPTTQIRIALVSVGEIFGGVERHLLDLSGYLQGRIDDVVVVLFTRSEPARQLIEVGRAPVILESRFALDLRLPRALANVLAERRINIVHTHGYKASVITSLAAAYYHPVTVVKTEHGRPEPLGQRPLAWLKSRMYTFLDLWATRLSRASVCYVTRDLQSHLYRDHRGFITSRVIHNGISPLPRSPTRPPPEYSGDFVEIAVVGRLDPVKGLDYAIRAMADERMPHNARLNIIGHGPEAPALQDLAKRLGVATRVRLLGFRSPVYDYLAHARLLLMPSLYEGLPYTLLEAMSLGVPIVATRTGGLAEVLQHRESALLVPIRNPAAIAEAVASLAADEALAARLARAAAREQRLKYSLAAMGGAYVDFYQEALQQRAGRRS
jgi:glycosyltransferase involved in cell wall biosynthesis